MKLVLYIMKRSEVPVEEIHSRVEPFGPWIQEEIMTTYDKLIEKGQEQGREAGLMEGESRGTIQGKIESARRMLEEGFKVEVIVRITGLSEDDLRQAGWCSRRHLAPIYTAHRNSRITHRREQS